jgi:hypothetical protein
MTAEVAENPQQNTAVRDYAGFVLENNTNAQVRFSS